MKGIDKMLVAQRIKQLRKEANLTQEELADMLGLKKVSIQKYENGGVTNIKSETLEKLGKIFNVSPAYIMGWDRFDNIDTNDIKEDLQILDLIRIHCGYVGIELFQIFNKLNEEGKRKILYYAEDIAENSKYKSNLN